MFDDPRGGETTRATATKILATTMRVVAIETMMPGRTLAVVLVLAARNQNPARVIAMTRAGPSGSAIRETTIRVIVTRGTSLFAIGGGSGGGRRGGGRSGGLAEEFLR